MQASETSEVGLIDRVQRLSESKIWRAQKQLYIDEGINIWHERSEFWTSNVRTVEALASIVATYLIETITELDLTQPFYFFEIGGGSGCFAYRFVNAFSRLKEGSALAKLRFKYVLTDIIPGIVPLWTQNAHLQPLISEGTLECGVFDPHQEDGLVCSSFSSLDSWINPPLVIANSVFDTIAADRFHIESGNIHEIGADVFTICGASLHEALLNNEVYVRPAKAQSSRIEPYAQPFLDGLLTEYAKHYATADVTIPVTAFRILSKLSSIFLHGFSLLTCSKGFTRPPAAQDQSVEYADLSLPLNFDALSAFAKEHNGFSIFADMPGINKNVSLTGLPGNSVMEIVAQNSLAGPVSGEVETSQSSITGKDKYKRTVRKINELIVRDGMLEEFELGAASTAQLSPIKAHNAIVKLIDIMQSTYFDPIVFESCVAINFDAIEQQIDGASDDCLEKLCDALFTLNQNIYSFDSALSPSPKRGDEPLAILTYVWKRARESRSTLQLR